MFETTGFAVRILQRRARYCKAKGKFIFYYNRAAVDLVCKRGAKP
jgi:hypothetical protein